MLFLQADLLSVISRLNNLVQPLEAMERALRDQRPSPASSIRSIGKSRNCAKVHRHPIAEIHPATAERHGIRDGDWMWIETRRGRTRQREIDERHRSAGSRDAARMVVS